MAMATGMATTTATGMHAHGLSHNQKQVIMGLAHFYIIQTSWCSSANISWKLSNYKTNIITWYYNGKYAWTKWYVNRHGYMHGCMATCMVTSTRMCACHITVLSVCRTCMCYFSVIAYSTISTRRTQSRPTGSKVTGFCSNTIQNK